MIPGELANAGLDHVTLVSPHSQKGINDYKKIFGRNLSTIDANDILIANLRNQYGDKLDQLCIGAPDGADKPNDQGQRRAVAVAQALYGDSYQEHMFGIAKNRLGAGETEVKKFIGAEHVKGKICIVVDDMISSGGTMIKASERLKKEGAAEVHIAAIHGIFCDNGMNKMAFKRDESQNQALIHSILVTNSLPVEKIIDASSVPDITDIVHVIDIAPFVAERIKKTSANSEKIAINSASNRARGIHKKNAELMPEKKPAIRRSSSFSDRETAVRQWQR